MGSAPLAGMGGRTHGAQHTAQRSIAHRTDSSHGCESDDPTSCSCCRDACAGGDCFAGSKAAGGVREIARHSGRRRRCGRWVPGADILRSGPDSCWQGKSLSWIAPVPTLSRCSLTVARTRASTRALVRAGVMWATKTCASTTHLLTGDALENGHVLSHDAVIGATSSLSVQAGDEHGFARQVGLRGQVVVHNGRLPRVDAQPRQVLRSSRVRLLFHDGEHLHVVPHMTVTALTLRHTAYGGHVVATSRLPWHTPFASAACSHAQSGSTVPLPAGAS